MSTSPTTKALSPLPPRVAPLPPMRPKTPTVQAPAMRSAAPAAPAPTPPSNLMALHAAYGNGAVARAFAPRPASPARTVSPESRSLSHRPSIVSQHPTAASPAAKVQALSPQAPPKVEPPPKLPPTPAEPTAKTETKPPAHEHKDDKVTAAHPPAESKKPSAHAATAPGKDQTKGPADAKKAPKEKPAGAPHTPPVGEKPETRAKGEAGEKPVVMHPTSAHADPAFQAVVGRVHHAAGKLKTHAPAHAKAEQAQKAATVDPGAEAHSRAAAGQVDAMDQVKPKPFDRAAFVAAVKKEVEKATPKTLGDVDEFKKRGTASEIKPNLTGQVDAGKREAQGDIPERVAAVPDPSGVKTDPVTPLPPEAAAPAPADIHADAAVPTPRPDAEVSLQAGSASLDQKMTDAHVSDEQLRRSNEPSFQGALKAKGEAKANAAAAPHAFRQGEQATLSHAKGEAHATAQAQMGGLHAAHGQATGHVGAQQAAAKAQAEKERTDFIQKLEGIYQETKKNVEDCLKKLDVDVNLAFDQGAAAAQKAFENEVDTNITQFKLIRYGASLGALWLADYILGPPPEVEQFYRTARDNYIKAMDAVLANIAMIVDTGLADAKTKVSEGKTKIQGELKLLPKSLQAFGQEAARNIQGKFDQLQQSVDAKQGQLIDSLAQKYSENLQQVDAKITAMKEADRGLISKASEAIDGAIEAIINMKNMLMKTLAKAGDAIDLIIADPIGFLANLASAVKQGFMNFVGKIGTYLEQGLMGWLFGVLEDAGIKIPATLDLKSIFGVACQVLGLTYANIRSRAVKIVGPKVVAALETAAEIFMILKNEGPAGLWKWIKEKLTNFKDMVIGAIKQWVVTKVIMAGVNWVISLLNPASAFVKACIAIYDIIMFFVENGKRILTLVNAVIDSVTAIAKGSLGAAAAFVENSLARAVPLVISFLADLLGLGGVSEAIKGVIEKAREYVNIAIDWVINKAVEMVKAIGAMLGFGKDDKDKETKPEAEATLEEGFSMGPEGHTLTATLDGDSIRITMASGTSIRLINLIDGAISEVQESQRSGEEKSQIVGLLKLARKSADENTILQDWNLSQKDPTGAGRNVKFKEQFMPKRLAMIITDLTQLANRYSITSLKGAFGKLKKRNLPPGYDVRWKLYERGSKWSGVSERMRKDQGNRVRPMCMQVKGLWLTDKQKGEGEWKKLKDQDLIPDWAVLASFDWGTWQLFEFEVHHKNGVDQHWNGEGRNTGDTQRRTFMIDEDNLRVIPEEAHRKIHRQEEKPEDYKREVGEDFTSEFAGDGKPNARTIDGMPFVDDAGKPL